MIGTRILTYEIKSKIADGGMGAVYLAEHVQLGRKVAIKSLHPELVRNEQVRSRFKKEAMMMSQLQHKNIVTLYDFLEEENALYLVLEYVDGAPLDDCLKKIWGPIPSDRILNFMVPVLEACAYAHEKGIVHRDLKPANILVSSKGDVKMLDFGIAKMMNDASNKLTKTGMQMGTVYYMSPEQVKGQEIDIRTDIYSLGVTLFQMLTGVSPYEGMTTEFEIYSQIVNQPLQRAGSLVPGVHPALEYIIAIATSKERERRFQNCWEMMHVLQNPHMLQRYNVQLN